MFGVEIALCLMFGILIFSLISGYPVGLSLGGSGVIGLMLIAGLSHLGVLDPTLVPSLDIAAQRSLGTLPDRLANGLFGGSAAAVFLAIVLFVLMGTILEVSGVAAKLFAAGDKLLTRVLPKVQGKAVLVLVLVATLLAAASGVVGASVSALAIIAYPSLRHQGAGPRLASGLVIATGTLGQIIPPSVVLVLLAVAINEFYAPLHPGDIVEVFELFGGAIIPGLLLAVAYAFYGLIAWPRNPKITALGAAAEVAKGVNPGEQQTSVQKSVFRDIVTLFSPMLLIVCVLGSVLAGWATLADAAVFGVLGAIVLGLILGQLTIARLWQALVRAARMWSNIGLILIGALVFTLSLKGFGGDLYLQSLLGGITNPWMLLALVLVLFFVLGFFLEFIELTALLVPVFGPVLFASDIDPVWVGVMIALVVQTSFLTPPMGLSLFYFKAAQRDLPVAQRATATDIYQGVVPFVLIQLGVIFAFFLIGLAVS